MKSNHWGAALASLLVVGLGQILKGEGDKGLKLILFFYFFLPTCIYLSLQISGALFLVVMSLGIVSGSAAWLLNIWDALKHEALI